MSERFAQYSLVGLIAENSRLVLDHQHGVLSQLSPLDEHCSIIEQQLFPHQECLMLVELLSNHPYHTPLENLLARLQGCSVEVARRQLYRALDERNSEQLVRPVRNVINRCRYKIRMFGVDIRSLPETGYMLFPDRRKGLGGIAS